MLPWIWVLLVANAASLDDWMNGMLAAHAAVERSDHGQAEKLYVDLVRQAAAPGYEARYPYALHNLAYSIHRQGRYAEAEGIYRRALAKAKADPGPADELQVRILNNLTNMYLVSGQYGAAARTLDRLSELPVNAYPREAALCAISRGNLLRLRGKPGEAESLLRDALARAESSLGRQNRFVAGLLNSIGLVLERTGRVAEAVDLHEQAVAIFAQVSGPEHGDTGLALAKLSSACMRSGQFERAEETAGRAAVILERRLGPNHSATAKVLLIHAAALRKLKRSAEAKPLERRARAIAASLRAASPADSVIDVADLR